MTLNGIKLLKLMFNEDETICVSDSQYGYHSIPFTEATSNKTITLVPTPESCVKRNIEWKPENFDKAHTDNIKLVALNPIKGWRKDEYCYKYRNFLVEIDTGTVESQIEYIKKLGVPYSAIVFSGNKSAHVLISLDIDLPSEKVYRKLSEWLLRAIPLSDQQTKNPSRSIRVPGAIRENGNAQTLLEYNGKVSLVALKSFLDAHPSAKPIERKRKPMSDTLDISRIKAPWVAYTLINGLDPTKGRNKQWFSIAVEFALAKYTEDDTIEILDSYFSPEKDFTEREWLTAIRSGFKYAYERK
jgi:hypothetical protein